MAQQTINLGTVADDDTGDDLRTGGTKINENFTELYTTKQDEPSEGAFADGDKTKLDGIEAGADVTDTANVTAAGALMDSEVTNLAAVKAFDPAAYATAAQGATADAALQPGDVDDVPVNGQTAAPVSSNWAYDHSNASNPHGISAATIGVEPGATADQTGAEMVSAINTELGSTNWQTGGSSTGLTAVANIAALTALAKSGLSDGDVRFIRGYATAGDGGGNRVLRWDASSTDTENGGTIFEADEGGTGRWKHDFSGPINVKWFGAKGDGATNDTGAIQAALTAAAGGSVEFGAADDVYLISNNLIVPANTHVLGRLATIKVSASATRNDETGYESAAYFDDWAITTNGNDGVTIEGLKVDLSAGTNADYYNGIGVMDAFSPTTASADCTVRNCTVFGGGVIGISARNTTNLKLIDNTITEIYGASGTAGGGINIAYSDTIECTGNLAKYIGVASDLTGTWKNVSGLVCSGSKNTLIANNTFYATGGSCLRVRSSSVGVTQSNVVSNNTIIGAGGNGISIILKVPTDYGVLDSTVVGNSIIGYSCAPGDTGHAGITIGGATGSAGLCIGGAITGNIVNCLAPWETTSFSATDLVITGSKNTLKSGSASSGLSSIGIDVGGAAAQSTLPNAKSITVSGNTVSWSPADGIRVAGSDAVTVSGNAISNCGWDAAHNRAAGIHVFESIGTGISGNTISEQSPGAANSLNGSALYIEDSARTGIYNNTITFSEDTTNYKQVTAVQLDCPTSKTNFSEWSYSEEMTVEFGPNTILGYGALDAGHNFYCRSTSGGRLTFIDKGWKNFSTITGGRSLSVYERSLYSASAAAKSETLPYAADLIGTEILVVAGGSSGTVTVGVQSGETMDGSTDGTSGVTAGNSQRFISNGVDGWLSV